MMSFVFINTGFKREINLVIGLILFLGMMSSCQRKVCPAYHSAFQVGSHAKETDFSYFTSPETDSILTGKAIEHEKNTIPNDHGMLMFEFDTVPKDEGLFAFAGKNKNGLANSNVSLFDKYVLENIFKNRKGNIQRHVVAKVTLETPEDTTGTVVFDNTLKEDEMYYDSSILGDAPPVPVLDDPVTMFGEDVVIDSTSVNQQTDSLAADSVDVYYKYVYGNANVEQLVYDMTIGWKIMAHVDSMRPKWKEELEKRKKEEEEKDAKGFLGLFAKKESKDSLETGPTEKVGIVGFIKNLFGKKQDSVQVDEDYNHEWYAGSEEEALDEGDSQLEEQGNDILKRREELRKEREKKEEERSKLKTLEVENAEEKQRKSEAKSTKFEQKQQAKIEKEKAKEQSVEEESLKDEEKKKDVKEKKGAKTKKKKKNKNKNKEEPDIVEPSESE